MNDTELNRLACKIREADATMQDAKQKRDTLAAEYNLAFDQRKKDTVDGLDTPSRFDFK
jgi:hypothetical protein